jgi:hypothetical protein
VKRYRPSESVKKKDLCYPAHKKWNSLVKIHGLKNEGLEEDIT